jgi:hypothetical protein
MPAVSGTHGLKKTFYLLERVQRRATKQVQEISDKSYSERLRILGLPTLQYRRKRYDMLQVFKILNNIDKVENSEILLKLVKVEKTRGHSFKLVKRYCRTERRRNSFFSG